MKTEQLAEALGQEIKTRDEESESEILSNIKASVKKIQPYCYDFQKRTKVPFHWDETLFRRNGTLIHTVQKPSQIGHTCTVLDQSSVSSRQSFVQRKRSFDPLPKIIKRRFYMKIKSVRAA